MDVERIIESTGFSREQVEASERLGTEMGRRGRWLLPDESERRFLSLQREYLEDDSRRPAEVREEDAAEWRRRSIERAHNIRAGLRASDYHLQRVEGIQADLLNFALVHRDDFELLGGTFAAVHEVLGFEYQAFHFALGRTLNYLAVAVAGYFGRSTKSFRRLPKALTDAEPAIIRDSVVATHEAELPHLGLSDDGMKSPRDLSAHREPVEAGVFQVIRKGKGEFIIGVTGGGEEIAQGAAIFTTPDLTTALGEALRARLNHVERIIFAMYCDLKLFDHAVVPHAKGG